MGTRTAHPKLKIGSVDRSGARGMLSPQTRSPESRVSRRFPNCEYSNRYEALPYPSSEPSAQHSRSRSNQSILSTRSRPISCPSSCSCATSFSRARRAARACGGVHIHGYAVTPAKTKVPSRRHAYPRSRHCCVLKVISELSRDWTLRSHRTRVVAVSVTRTRHASPSHRARHRHLASRGSAV